MRYSQYCIHSEDSLLPGTKTHVIDFDSSLAQILYNERRSSVELCYCMSELLVNICHKIAKETTFLVDFNLSFQNSQRD